MTKREVSAVDVYRTGKLLVDKHGDEAPIHAAMTALDPVASRSPDRTGVCAKAGVRPQHPDWSVGGVSIAKSA